MNDILYRPSIYEGNDPYIFVSYHPADRETILPVLEKLNRRGFRFWLNDGITPGMDADEVIAAHIEGSDYFIAFLSGKYLSSLDYVDELNFSRDTNKPYLLIYLEDVPLTYGLDMRFLRSQSIPAYDMDADEVFNRMIRIEEVSRFYGIADQKLRPAAEKFFEKLQELYPEHKVFALNAVSKELAKQISELYTKAGYASAERLMADYGFMQISTAEAKTMRSSVVYLPGSEPDAVRKRIGYITETLSAAYPDHVITDNLSRKYKSIYNSLLGLSVWLGYNTAEEMLNAYGFSGVYSDAGRTAVDYNRIIALLTEKYAGKKPPASLNALLADNKDLRSGLKTLSNRASELFGMSLLQYFRQIGLVVSAEKEEAATKTAENRVHILNRIRQLYANSDCGYGTYEDVEDTINACVLKENRNGSIYVFSCSSGSETVRVPLGVEYIAAEAFAGQNEITTLILPPTLKEIRSSAFADCSGMHTLVFSPGIEKIEGEAFAGCTALQKVEFPASLKYIGSGAFADCEELADVSFGNPRINIQEDAFDGCAFDLDSLQDASASPAEYFELKVDRKNTAKILAYTGDEEVVVIPAMISGHPVTSLEKGCFKENESVREIYMNDSIAALNGDVFKDCVNLEKIHISNAVTKFTASAFAGCTSLTEVNIPDSMTDVPRGLFKDAPLSTVYIGKGVKNLSADAFHKGEADIATGMFFKKAPVQTLIIDSDNENFSAAGTLLLSKDGKRLIAELGAPEQVVIPEGVEVIEPAAYEKLGSVCEVIFPSTLKKIGEKAFAGIGITRIEIPASVEVIDKQAFSYCRFLGTADLTDGLKVIAQQAFEGCPIGNVYIPASVESLGSDSFLAVSTYQGTVEQKFAIDTANQHLIADGVALYVKSDKGLTLVKAYHRDLRPMPNMPACEPIAYTVHPDTTAVADHAFARCSNLSAVTLPEGLLSIGDMAFWDCAKLAEIHIPASCTSVSARAFFGTNAARI